MYHQDAHFDRVLKRTMRADVQLSMPISPECNMDTPAGRQLHALRQDQAFQVCDNLPSEVRREIVILAQTPFCVRPNVQTSPRPDVSPCTGPGFALIRHLQGY